MNKRGRPTSYTEELGKKICEGLAEGKSLASICKEEGMPAAGMVYRWIELNESFRESYTRAKSDACEKMAEEILEIADTEPDSNRARVRIDARKWVAAKLKPKKYGDKIDVNHEGSVNIDASALMDRLETALSRALEVIK